MSSIVEVVLYQIKPDKIEDYQNSALLKFQKLVREQPGFCDYQSFISCNQKGYFMDLVQWDCLDNAVAAAENVQDLQKSNEYADYLNAFERVELFHHFRSI